MLFRHLHKRTVILVVKTSLVSRFGMRVVGLTLCGVQVFSLQVLKGLKRGLNAVALRLTSRFMGVVVCLAVSHPSLS